MDGLSAPSATPEPLLVDGQCQGVYPASFDLSQVGGGGDEDTVFGKLGRVDVSILIEWHIWKGISLFFRLALLFTPFSS